MRRARVARRSSPPTDIFGPARGLALGHGNGRQGRQAAETLAASEVDFLADVLDRVDKTADGHFAELLPDRWKPPSQQGAATSFDA